MSVSKIGALKLSNVLALFAALAANAASVLLPLNGKSTKALSDALPNFFVPAPFTFSIWGVIYLLLIAFCGWQFFGGANRGDRDLLIEKLGWRPALSFLLNGAWLFAWHWQAIGLSLFIMTAYLSVLASIAVALGRDSEHWLPKAAFGANFGWISIATIANAAAYLVSIGWRGGESEQLIAAAMTLIGAAAAAAVAVLNRNWAFCCAVLWALYGVWAARTADGAQTVRWAAAIGAGIVLLSMIYAARLKKTI